MQSCFDEVKKNFGFGCMRLPMKGKEVDFEETSQNGGHVSRERLQLF